MQLLPGMTVFLAYKAAASVQAKSTEATRIADWYSGKDIDIASICKLNVYSMGDNLLGKSVSAPTSRLNCDFTPPF